MEEKVSIFGGCRFIEDPDPPTDIFIEKCSVKIFVVVVCNCHKLLSGQSYQDVGSSSQWLPQPSQPHQTLGASSLFHQDNPPTYDAAMATGVGNSGGWAKPS